MQVCARHDLLVLIAGLLGYCIIQYFDFPRERIEMQVMLATLFAYAAFHTRDVWVRVPGVFIGKSKFAFIGLALGGLSFNLVIGWNRIGGEIHNVRMMKDLAKRDYSRVLGEARAANNRFYEYNDVAVPLVWYEGIAFYQMNESDRSVAAFREAYRLNPWAFQVINNYASALVRANRFREAIALYEKALSINPRYDEGKFNIAYSWYALGDYQQALDWLSKVDTIPNPQVEDERLKNQKALKQKAEFEQRIRQRMQQ